MKTSVSQVLSIILVGLSIVVGHSAAAQSLKPAQQPATAAKTPKVWTGDDLIGLRKPSDNLNSLAPSKELSAAAPKSDNTSATAPNSIPPKQVSKLSDPNLVAGTIPELQKKIEIAQNELLQISSNLRSVEQEYSAAKDEERRKKLQITRDLLQEDLEDRKNELDLLQARLVLLLATPHKS